MNKDIIGWLGLTVFNIGTIYLLRVTLNNINVRSVLREKNPRSQPPGTRATPEASAPGSVSDPAVDNTSYSRLSGFIGSIVLVCFLWGVGNVVIYEALNDVDSVTKFLSALGTYFLAGASLFAPYAVNQLSAIFRPSGG
jgi:hypothetical protein